MITLTYHDTFELRLRESYQVMPLEANSEEDWFIMMLAVMTMIPRFDWLNDVTNSRHNVFATSASADKTAFSFHFTDVLRVLKSCNDA